MRRLLAAALLAALPWCAMAQQPSPAPPASSAPAMSPPGAWQTRGTAELSVLDKVRAQATPLSIRVGQSATSGSLTITVRSCVARPPDLPADSAAFVDVADSHPTGTGFHGWMLANAPSLNQMQHPIYDVRVTACR